MSKTAKVFKWVTLSLSVITFTTIIVQSCLDEQTSSASSTWVASVIKSFINDVLHRKEDVKIIPPNTVKLSLSDNYQYNKVTNYKPNEIGLGCTKKLDASYEPSDTTDKSTSFVAEPSDRVNLVQRDNGLFVEALSLGEVTITATSKADTTKSAKYTFSIVDLTKPSDFEIVNKGFDLTVGKSGLLDINIKEEHIGEDQLLACRFYDISKLDYSSSNDSVASVDDGIVKANGAGDAVISVSNGTITKTINVSVKENPSPIVKPTTISITGDKSYCEIMDLNFDSQEKGMHNTPLYVDFGGVTPTDNNVKWEIIGDPLVAKVDNKGVVRGYRKLSDENVSFKVKATSVADPNVIATFDMESRHVIPTEVKLNKSSISKNEQGEYIVYNNKTTTVGVTFSPINVTKEELVVTSSDNNVVKATVNGSSITLMGLKEGAVTINVSSKYNENAKDSVSLKAIDTPAINESNWAQFKTAVRKFIGGHATLFMLLAIFLTTYVYLVHKDRKTKSFTHIATCSSLLVGFVTAGLSEFIQYFVPSRTSSMSDVGIDMIGFGIGFAIVYLVIGIAYLKHKINSKKKRKDQKSTEHS